jgi:protein-L-isoaspartate(D-aspartate) O-methyltransferase
MRPTRDTSPLVDAARAAGVTDERVLASLAAVPRERFVRADDRRRASADRPLPTSSGQTTSQPSLIARMLELLELTGDERVLEIGTGPGYQAALLAALARQVHTVEVEEELAAVARVILADLGLTNVEVVVGDGRAGLPAHAPFDAIVVAAAADEVPPALASQLADGGRLVAPLGGSDLQYVRVLERHGDRLEEVDLAVPVRFVPLVDRSPPTDDAG